MSITSFPALTRIASDGNAVSFAGPTVDAFGRLRASQPFTLFDSQHRYEKNSLFDEAVTGSATVTYSANESSVLMNVTTASGDAVVRQSYRSFAYQPGKSLLVMNTFVMPVAQTSLRCRIGYFSTQNGVFLERSGSSISFVRRSYTSGSVVDVSVAQASWNGDRLDGTGASGYTLDLTKSQILWQDFEWLGVGSVRVGFVINGLFIVAHTFHHANNVAAVYMTTAVLPIRYEIEALDTLASASTLKQICSTVVSEGGYERRVALDVARMSSANSSISTSFVPLVSIRLASGRENAVVLPDGYHVLGSGAGGEFEIVLVKNATLTGASFTSSASNNVSYDISATSYTGGTIVRNAYTSSGAQTSGSVDSPENYNWDLQIGSTISGVSDIYTLAVRTLSGTHTAIGSMSFWDLT